MGWLILAITTGVALGLVVGYALVLTAQWLVNKIKCHFNNIRTKKVIATKMSKLINESENRMSYDAFKKITDKGFTHVIAAVNDKNEIEGKIDFIKDTNPNIDLEVEELLGKEECVVVEL